MTNNRTKVTVACRACQKKKIKCTGISPCTNCIRSRYQCIFSGTAKKRGPRNGNIEVIKSSAHRIESVLKKNPNLRGQIHHMLAHENSHPPIRSTKLPRDVPIVIIDDETGVITDASQSHGIPRPLTKSNYLDPFMQGDFSQNDDVTMKRVDIRGREIVDSSRNPQSSPILQKPVPVYPHVTAAQSYYSCVPLPSISELGISLQSRHPTPFPNTLPTPDYLASGKAVSMSIINPSFGIEVLLPPAPDLANPLDPTIPVNKNQWPVNLPPLNLPASSGETHPSKQAFFSFPSPVSPQFMASPKSVSSGLYSENPSAPTPPMSPRNCLSYLADSHINRLMALEKPFSRRGID